MLWRILGPTYAYRWQGLVQSTYQEHATNDFLVSARKLKKPTSLVQSTMCGKLVWKLILIFKIHFLEKGLTLHPTKNIQPAIAYASLPLLPSKMSYINSLQKMFRFIASCGVCTNETWTPLDLPHLAVHDECTMLGYKVRLS